MAKDKSVSQKALKTLIRKEQVDRILSTKGEMTSNEMKIIDAYLEQLGFVNTTAEKVGTASIHIRTKPARTVL